MDREKIVHVVELATSVERLRNLLDEASSVALTAADNTRRTDLNNRWDRFVALHEQLVRTKEQVLEIFGQAVESPPPIGKLYRRQQGRYFWSNNDDGGLPQGNAACGNDPFVFTVEPSGKLLLARMQRFHFGPMPYGEPRVADTYFVFPEDIEAVQ